MKEYVSRAFGLCKNEQDKEKMQAILHEKVSQSINQPVDWSSMPLPRLEPLPLPKKQMKQKKRTSISPADDIDQRKKLQRQERFLSSNSTTPVIASTWVRYSRFAV